MSSSSSVCYDGEPFVNGLCNDQSSVMITASVVTAILGVYYVGVFVAMTWKIRSPAMRAHGTVLTVVGCFSSTVFIFFLLSRAIIGRKYYSCFIYLIFFSLSPIAYLSMLLRLWRLLFITLLNRTKVKVTKCGQSSDTLTDPTSCPSVAGQEETDDEMISTKNDDVMNAGSHVSSPSSSVESEKPCQEETEKQETSRSVPSDKWELRSSNAEPEGLPSAKLTSGLLRTNTNSMHLRRKIRLLSALQSDMLMLIIFVVVGVIHVVTVTITIIIQESLHLRDKLPTEWLVYDHPNLFGSDFFAGCAISTLITTVVGLESIAFGIFSVLLLIILFLLRVKDAWGVMVSVTLTASTWIIIGLVNIFIGFIPVVYYLWDYFFPFVIITCMALALDTTYNVVMPFIVSFRNGKNSKRKTSSSLEENRSQDEENYEYLLLCTLRDEKSRKKLLKFAERSFCPEAVMCWKDCERYLSAKSVQERQRQAAHILETYLEYNAPLELNLASKQRNLKWRQEQMNDTAYMKDRHWELMEDIQMHCEVDLQDIFGRFIVSPENQQMMSLRT